ncbi:nucleobase-ascorbate transporter 12 [Striga asiatica]|uniref:Nucleobase-ascorbate transporter 12 n=1 Tax=Striga asiatica TaxID=4170 RepID=A0A5A7RA71_STRAF|nr:nucleobase-ascorbate transporter 12 [Striga asiatica]
MEEASQLEIGADGVLGELAGEDEPDGGLDLARRDGRLFVVTRQPRRLHDELLEDVVDEAVHYPHGLARDPDVWVNLLQDLEYVDLVRLFFTFFFRFPSPAPSFEVFFSAAVDGFFSAGFFSALGAID